MRSKEIPDMDSLDYGQRVNDGMSKFFRNGIVFHWTMKHPEHNGMTHGGLYETSEAAEAARGNQAEIAKNSIYFGLPQISYIKNRLEDRGRKNTPIIELQEGQRYKPWGVGGRILTHGVDDGTHGSEIKVSDTLENVARRVLKVG